MSSFISLYSLNTLFIEINLSWLIYQSIKVLEIRASIVSDSDVPNSTILSCFFSFFLIIGLYFLILAVITRSFYPTAELVKPTE